MLGKTSLSLLFSESESFKNILKSNPLNPSDDVEEELDGVVDREGVKEETDGYDGVLVEDEDEDRVHDFLSSFLGSTIDGGRHSLAIVLKSS